MQSSSPSHIPHQPIFLQVGSVFLLLFLVYVWFPSRYYKTEIGLAVCVLVVLIACACYFKNVERFSEVCDAAALYVEGDMQDSLFDVSALYKRVPMPLSFTVVKMPSPSLQSVVLKQHVDVDDANPGMPIPIEGVKPSHEYIAQVWVSSSEAIWSGCANPFRIRVAMAPDSAPTCDVPVVIYKKKSVLMHGRDWHLLQTVVQIPAGGGPLLVWNLGATGGDGSSAPSNCCTAYEPAGCYGELDLMWCEPVFREHRPLIVDMPVSRGLRMFYAVYIEGGCEDASVSDLSGNAFDLVAGETVGGPPAPHSQLVSPWSIHKEGHGSTFGLSLIRSAALSGPPSLKIAGDANDASDKPIGPFTIQFAYRHTAAMHAQHLVKLFGELQQGDITHNNVLTCYIDNQNRMCFNQGSDLSNILHMDVEAAPTSTSVYTFVYNSDESGTVEIYQNSRLAVKESGWFNRQGSYTWSVKPLLINPSPATYPMRGVWAGMAAYDRALSSSEVSSLYAYALRLMNTHPSAPRFSKPERFMPGFVMSTRMPGMPMHEEDISTEEEQTDISVEEEDWYTYEADGGLFAEEVEAEAEAVVPLQQSHPAAAGGAAGGGTAGGGGAAAPSAGGGGTAAGGGGTAAGGGGAAVAAGGGGAAAGAAAAVAAGGGGAAAGGGGAAAGGGGAAAGGAAAVAAGASAVAGGDATVSQLAHTRPYTSLRQDTSTAQQACLYYPSVQSQPKHPMFYSTSVSAPEEPAFYNRSELTDAEYNAMTIAQKRLVLDDGIFNRTYRKLPDIN
jgi:hypothetical protein